jgi:hypothetical protein
MLAINNDNYTPLCMRVRRSIIVVLNNLKVCGNSATWLLTAISLAHLRLQRQARNLPIALKDLENAQKTIVGVATSIGAISHTFELWLTANSLEGRAIYRNPTYRRWTDKYQHPISTEISVVRLYVPTYDPAIQTSMVIQCANELVGFVHDTITSFTTFVSEESSFFPAFNDVACLWFRLWGTLALQQLDVLSKVAVQFIFLVFDATRYRMSHLASACNILLHSGFRDTCIVDMT